MQFYTISITRRNSRKLVETRRKSRKTCRYPTLEKVDP